MLYYGQKIKIRNLIDIRLLQHISSTKCLYKNIIQEISLKSAPNLLAHNREMQLNMK